MGHEGSDQPSVNYRATGIGGREPPFSARDTLFSRSSKCTVAICPSAAPRHTLSGGGLVCAGILSGGSERSLFDLPCLGFQPFRKFRCWAPPAGRKTPAP